MPWLRRLGAALVGTKSQTPKWIKPQLTRQVAEAPAGHGWLHEIKYDGYRMLFVPDDLAQCRGLPLD